MSRLGLLVGPTSGMALAGLFQYLEKVMTEGTLGNLRNSAGEVLCVFPCPDGPLPYLDEYPNYVDASEFPVIRNEDLWVTSSSVSQKSVRSHRVCTRIVEL